MPPVRRTPCGHVAAPHAAGRAARHATRRGVPCQVFDIPTDHSNIEHSISRWPGRGAWCVRPTGVVRVPV